MDVNAQREHKRPGPTSDQAPHQAPRSKLSAAAARVDPNVTGTASEAKDVKTVDAVPGAVGALVFPLQTVARLERGERVNAPNK